jgi:hypothetical protein
MPQKELAPISGEHEKRLTSKQRQALLLQEAHGKSVLLSIGVSDYNKNAGFDPLKTCSSDAIAVKNAFLDVWQLNADTARILTLSSKGADMPSKGIIIQYVKKASNSCEPADRLIIYFSGHGQRLKDASGEDKFYLVPQDVYDESDPEALVSFDKILELIESSDAKQKIIIIDACMSGPTIEGKKFLPAQYSKKFLAEYMQKTKGVVIIASSSETGSSFMQSPNPKLSLFTYFLIMALRGEPRALDKTILTTDSLFQFLSTEVKRTAKSYQKEQAPAISCKTSGVPILADFSQSIIPPDSFDLDGYPVTEVLFRDYEKLNVKEILTKIKSWSYSQEYLESKVNEQLGEHFEESLGEKASSLRKAIGFSPSEVGVEDNTISFPAGAYTIEYSAEDKRTGKLIVTLTLESDWFGRPDDIDKIVDSLEMSPSEMTVELSKPVDPSSVVPGLEARGWEITSQLTRKIEAKADTYRVRIETDSITFRGFVPGELFGSNAKKDTAILASTILALTMG